MGSSFEDEYKLCCDVMNNWYSEDRSLFRCIANARDQPTVDSADFEPPWNRLTSEQPVIPINRVDVTQRPVAFGRWALPKLRRELHNPDTQVVIEAINSIMDLLHDPERGYEALVLKIPDRMADLLRHSLPEIRERACMTLTVIAGLADGKEAIVKNKLSLKNMALLVQDVEPTVRHKVAVLLEMIARSWTAADYLVDAKFTRLLLRNVLEELEDIICIHLETLRSLMYGAGKAQALNNNAFDIFLALMEHKHLGIKSRASYCMMMITSSYAGKQLAYHASILPRLNALLHIEDKHVYTAAAAALMFCTVKSRAKWRASEMSSNLVPRLVELTNHWHYPPAQLYSIKALTNICEHPAVRKEVKEKYYDRLEQIVVGNHPESPVYKKHKEILLDVVNWVPWSNK